MAGPTLKRVRKPKFSSARKRGRPADIPAVESDPAVRQYVQALKDGAEHSSSSEPSPSGAKVKGRSAEKADAPVVVEEDSGAESDDISSSGEESDSKSDGDRTTAAAPAESAPEGDVSDLKCGVEVPNVHVTVLLESANLEAIKLPGSRGGHALLSSDEHGTMLRKMKRDPNDARPDITHQCLLTLLDSPLNKAGKLTVYIRTKRNVLIKVHSQTRIPRTIRRFSGLMVELLQRLKVRSTNGTEPLLQVIRNPIVSHLPMGQRRIVCTYNCDNIVDVRHHAKETIEKVTAEKKSLAASLEQNLKDEERQDADVVAAEKKEPLHVLYVVGAMAHGKVDVDWADEEICMSEYPLSAATVCSRILFSYECMMGVL